MTTIKIPELSLVVLIGTSGAGKSTFAKRHFKATEIVSSDFCRATVSDDENSLDANQETFELLHFIVEKRLSRGLLTVVDATNLRSEDRKALLQIAKKQHVLTVSIVLNMPLKICQERNLMRVDRSLPNHVIRKQYSQLRQSFSSLGKEGFKFRYEFKSPSAVENIHINRTPLFNNLKHETGAFDLIGDVHGCFVELRELLQNLGYRITKHRDRTNNYGYTVQNPTGRKAIFVGDLVDRGPASNEVLRLVMSMVNNEQALCVRGNHDHKLYRKLNGKEVQIKHGLAETLEQLDTEPVEFVQAVQQFLRRLTSHYIFDEGRLLVAHAGLKEKMHGRTSRAVQSYCMYGETSGEVDSFGLPVRHDWAKDYRGKPLVVYGHTPVVEATFRNRTVDIDTGCVFGGTLTALRYPEREFVSVAAKKQYAVPSRPIEETVMNKAILPNDGLVHIEDVQGKRVIETAFHQNIVIREENAIAALEIMSRFAVNPKWLVYLPPTMSPSETSHLDGYLEYPTEAFDYYQNNGVSKVICEEKHMGSRAVIVLGKDEAAIETHFGIQGEGIGKIITRTGRAFFSDTEAWENLLLERLQTALSKTGFWEQLATDWVVLDCELMPWSAKAQSLLQDQYAAVGACANAVLTDLNQLLAKADQRTVLADGMLATYGNRVQQAAKFRAAYRPYCWEVNKLADFKLAPFHILATEGKVHHDKTHEWHMETIHAFCKGDTEILLPTTYKIVDLNDPQAVETACTWWENRTANGSEGMVVKPLDFITKGPKGYVQPAVKCRGKEYLRIIYGLDYDHPENLNALRKRGLSRKRRMASKEFALGMEALERFVQKDALRRVHECVFGVLAMESEPVDPRL